ncbi:hypothetical protein [Dolichospermum flos-aquae]|uniref:Uncharacterized protein n=1 Tax=Dolichospermum flos-aquae CCAP 1403/13F TaxID=315271 RepID=A0A6H2BZP7_DOLFA|nr:hypothetical protein [Dolichospermum flos-aquae]QJB44199.1 hypothetical protein HGD76_08370 [Dolichospermum flos-aquae CCAP 1403/13F]
MANATLRYQTNANFITKQTIYKLPSCTSFNPGYPDMANATLRYQTNTTFITKQTI